MGATLSPAVGGAGVDFWKLVTESATDLVSVIGPEGRYRYVSPALERALGYGPEERIGRSCFELVHPNDLGRVRSEFERALRIRGTYDRSVEYRIRHRDGTYKVFETTGSNQLHEPSVSGLVIYSRDVTRRREREDALRAAKERLEWEALHDRLTGLPNRALFLDRLDHRVARVGRDDVTHQFAVLFLDLDDFKPINDRYGHHVGDEVLIQVARRIERCVRGADTVARLAGDEFTVLLEDVAGPEEAMAVAERTRTALLAPLALREIELRPSASIGVAMGFACRLGGQVIVRHADRAMYEAKRAGGAACRMYEPTLYPPFSERAPFPRAERLPPER